MRASQHDELMYRLAHGGPEPWMTLIEDRGRDWLVVIWPERWRDCDTALLLPVGLPADEVELRELLAALLSWALRGASIGEPGECLWWAEQARHLIEETP